MTIPSKKIIVLSAACLITIGWVGYSKVKPGSALNAPLQQLTVVASTSTSPNITRLQNKIENTVAADPTVGSPSLTDSISEDFAKNYLNLQQNDSLTVDNEAGLISSVALKYASTTKITLSLSDISTFPDTNTAQAKIFGNTTAKIILSYSNTLKTSPVDILNNQNNAATSSVTQQLVTIANAYRSMGLELQKVAAPQTFKPFYLNIINGYLALGDDIENMSVYTSDPVRGLIGMRNYQTDLLNEADLLKNFPIYFESNDILFSKEDSGSVWSSLEH